MKKTAESACIAPQKTILSRWSQTMVRALAMAVFISTTHHAKAQTIYVADSLTNDFYSTTPNGTNTTLATGLDYPTGIAENSSGNFFVSNNSNNTISKITFGSWNVSTFASGLSSPADLAFDTSGNLFVRNEGNGTISK